MLLLVVAGIGCRVTEYLARRPVWMDEAFIVANLRGKTVGGLLGRLDAVDVAPQAAPPLWLLAQRGLLVTLGSDELALRLLPLAAGSAAVVLFAVLARRALPPAGAVVAVGLFAFSDRLIWHATEVKPYSSDVLVAVLLTLVAAGPRDVTPATMLARAAAVAAAGVWLSYPTVFVFGGISLALLGGVVGEGGRAGGGRGDARRRTAPGVARYAACNLLVLASFALVYALVIRRQHAAALDAFWAEYFADRSRPSGLPAWLGQRLLALNVYAAGWTGAVLLPLTAVGTVALARASRRRWLAVLVAPLALVALAAVARLYPFDGRRLTTFLVPNTLLLGAAGAQAVVDRLCRTKRRAASALASALPPLLLAEPAAQCAHHLAVPGGRHPNRPAVEHVLARRGPDPGETPRPAYGLRPRAGPWSGRADSVPRPDGAAAAARRPPGRASGSAVSAPRGSRLKVHAMICCTTFPYTSVSRKSRPA